MDLDENKTREADLVAHHTLYNKNDAGNMVAQSYFQIVAEVKKSTHPWVIFKEEPQYGFMLGEGWNSLVYADGIERSSDKYKELTLTMMNSSLANLMGWFGYGIHEAFKKPDRPSSWYSAFTSICKAGEDKLKRNSSPTLQCPYLFFVKPIVIFDGILMSASLNEAGDIIIEKK